MPAVTPREIYAANPDLRRDLDQYWHSDTPVEAAMTTLEDLPTGPAAIYYMSELEQQGGEQWYRAKDILTWLSPELIVEHYGRETLLWAAATSVFSVVADRHRSQLERLGGYKQDRFERARLWTWRERQSGKGRDVMAEYELAHSVCEGSLDTLDLPTLVREALQPDVPEDSPVVHQYSVESIEPAKDRVKGYVPTLEDIRDPRVSYHVYMDAPTGVVLRSRGRPHAVVAFAMAKDNDELMIHQLQGLNGVRNYAFDFKRDAFTGEKVPAWDLKFIDWQKLMVGVAGRIAETTGLRSMGILAGSHNYGATHILDGEKKPHLTMEQAAKAYDVPAERLGFTRGDDGNWHKPLSNN